MGSGVFLRRARDRRDNRSRKELVQRVRAEFEEMPAHRLTCAQVQRLFGLPCDVRERVMAALIDDGLLTQDAEGRYVLASMDNPANGAGAGSVGRGRPEAAGEPDATL